MVGGNPMEICLGWLMLDSFSIIFLFFTTLSLAERVSAAVVSFCAIRGKNDIADNSDSNNLLFIR